MGKGISKLGCMYGATGRGEVFSRRGYTSYNAYHEEQETKQKKNVFQCVFEVDRDKGLTLTELADGVTVEDVVQHTGCEFKVSADLKKMGDVTQRETITT